uniref:DNA topoisomerase (ATP-hydrolyzing) n=1 Tax=Actinia equina TaxID=6106 RepID=A0A6C0WWL3_ACTEQ|nr:putative meiotic recombination protein SPO11 [Actinia equina]
MAAVGDGFWFNINRLKKQLLTSKRIEQLSELSPDKKNHEVVKVKNCSRQEVIKKLEELTEKIIIDISRKEAPFIESVGLQMLDDVSVSRVKFDSLTSIVKFAATLQVMSICHNLLQENKFATKRDIYYSDVMFYGTQSVVDEIVENISCMLKVPRHCLHVLATSKGLIAGDLRYREYDATYTDCRNQNSGVVVSSHVNGITDIYSDAKVVIVVEKEASFQRLMNDGLLERLKPCIVITGKGYPDVNTRQMLHKLWTTLSIPILGLVDADPHGIEILCVYKYGSKALSFDACNITVPVIQWLGVLPSDIERLSIPEHVRIPLSSRDRLKCQSLLERPFMKSQPSWKQEVEIMMTKGFKAEMQALSTISTSFLTDTYVTVKIRNGRWI